MTLRRITKEERHEREWTDVTTYEDYAAGRRIFVPGPRNAIDAMPPDDDYEYFLEQPYGEPPRWFPLMAYHKGERHE